MKVLITGFDPFSGEGMSIDNIKEGLRRPIEAAIDSNEDIKTVEGKEY